MSWKVADLHDDVCMLRCGPPLRPFVLIAAFYRLKRQSADNAPFRRL